MLIFSVILFLLISIMPYATMFIAHHYAVKYPELNEIPYITVGFLSGALNSLFIYLLVFGFKTHNEMPIGV